MSLYSNTKCERLAGQMFDVFLKIVLSSCSFISELLNSVRVLYGLEPDFPVCNISLFPVFILTPFLSFFLSLSFSLSRSLALSLSLSLCQSSH